MQGEGETVQAIWEPLVVLEVVGFHRAGVQAADLPSNFHIRISWEGRRGRVQAGFLNWHRG